MSPPVREIGAKGPRRRERASQRRRDLEGSDWRKKRERMRRRAEREMVRKRRGLGREWVVGWGVCGWGGSGWWSGLEEKPGPGVVVQELHFFRRRISVAEKLVLCKPVLGSLWTLEG